MKLLLTSQMIHNKSIENALSKLLDKPFSEATVCYIITSHNGAPGDKSWLVQNINSVHNLGWKNFYMLDVAGLDGLPKESWMQQVRDADVIIMGGGANYILSYWLERSDLLQEMPELLKTKVYVGASAGSMLAQKDLCTSSQAVKSFSDGDWDIKLSSLGYEGRTSDKALGLVDFLIRPHYGSEDTEFVTDDILQEIATKYGMSLYALDDESAVKVDGDNIEIISEGNWKKFDA